MKRNSYCRQNYIKFIKEKNKISQILFENYLCAVFFHKINQYDFITLMKDYQTINNHAVFQQLCKQVYISYKTLFNNLQYKYNKNLTKEENKIYNFLFRFHFLNKNDLIKHLFKNMVDENLINKIKTSNLFNDIQRLQFKEIDKLKMIKFKSLVIKNL